MTGISVTYIAALNRFISSRIFFLFHAGRLIELERMAGSGYNVDLYTERRDATQSGLMQFLAPTGDYFVRSIDPNGTVHGVLGQSMHGYFESSPNCDVRR